MTKEEGGHVQYSQGSRRIDKSRAGMMHLMRSRDIDMLRRDEGGLAFGVSKGALDGDAFHTYTLISPDKSAEFSLKHNVSGHRVHAKGPSSWRRSYRPNEFVTFTF